MEENNVVSISKEEVDEADVLLESGKSPCKDSLGIQYINIYRGEESCKGG